MDRVSSHELQRTYRQLLEDHKNLSAIVDVLRRECDEVHEYLDAAGVAHGERIPERLVCVAKAWFRNHPTSSSDHISVRLRGLLLKAGEVGFIYASGP